MIEPGNFLVTKYLEEFSSALDREESNSVASDSDLEEYSNFEYGPGLDNV